MTESYDDLDTLETAVLRHARAGMSPNAERRGTLLAKLNSGIGGQPLAPQPDLASLSELQSSSLPLAAGRVVSLTSMLLGAVVAGAAGFGAGYFYNAVATSDATSSFAQTQAASPTASKQITTKPHSVETGEAPDLVPVEETPTSHKLIGTTEGKERHRDKVEAKTTFYNELSYVRRAQSALQKGDGALALGLMESLDAVERKGALLAERNVTKVLALCLLDRVEEASRLAQRALQSSATEVYRRRLDASCVAAAIQATPALQAEGPEANVVDP